GKTTLVRAIVGALPARAGTITLGGVALRPIAPYRRAQMGIGYMHEDRRLVPDLTVEDNILLPVWTTRPQDATARLQATYDVIPELRPLAKRRTTQLSGGQQKIVALARAITGGTRLLLLDEPLEGVAPALAERICDVIGEGQRLRHPRVDEDEIRVAAGRDHALLRIQAQDARGVGRGDGGEPRQQHVSLHDELGERDGQAGLDAVVPAAHRLDRVAPELDVLVHREVVGGGRAE